MTGIIVDQVRIIGTNRVVWKAWAPCERSTAWPGGYGYGTITHLNGRAYGRLGTEVFTCPPAPAEYIRRGREADWRWERLIAHKVTTARAAHCAILAAMPKTLVPGCVTFDDDGTIEMEV